DRAAQAIVDGVGGEAGWVLDGGHPRRRRRWLDQFRTLAWTTDRARRGGSGALYSQSALARPNSLSRGEAFGWHVDGGVDGPGPARCRPVNQVRSGRKQP